MRRPWRSTRNAPWGTCAGHCTASRSFSRTTTTRRTSARAPDHSRSQRTSRCGTRSSCRSCAMPARSFLANRTCTNSPPVSRPSAHSAVRREIPTTSRGVPAARAAAPVPRSRRALPRSAGEVTRADPSGSRPHSDRSSACDPRWDCSAGTASCRSRSRRMCQARSRARSWTWRSDSMPPSARTPMTRRRARSKVERFHTSWIHSGRMRCAARASASSRRIFATRTPTSPTPFAQPCARCARSAPTSSK